MRLQTGISGLLVVFLSFVWGVAWQGEGQAMTIAENGKAFADIVIAPDAPEPERHAAHELAEFLRQVADAGFEVVYEGARPQHQVLC